LPENYKNQTLKDVDFEIMIEKKLLTLNLDRGDIRKIMQTIERDVEFLQ
jgi:hypothetical protein